MRNESVKYKLQPKGNLKFYKYINQIILILKYYYVFIGIKSSARN